MYQMNIALNFYSSVVCLILFMYLWIYYNKTDKSTRFFISMCLFNIFMALGDNAAWLFDGSTIPWHSTANKISVIIYYACIPPLLLSFAGYLFESYPVGANIRKLLWRGAAVLCCVHFICSVVSLWNGMYFTIGTDNIYRRGDWFWMSQLIPGLIFLMDVVVIFICRKRIGKRDVFFLSCYILFITIAQMVQILNYGIALNNTGVAVGLLFIFINIQSRRELRMEQQERELTESKVAVMLSQIQPHFLYNSLVVIRHLCRTDPKLAEDTVVEFSDYLRGNLDSLADNKLVHFEREMHHVKTYLSIEKKRFGSKLNVVYNINVQDFMIPVLTLQLIVENAVRYGITKKENGGTVEIKTEETESCFIITVTDDGVGFELSARAQDEDSGVDNRSHIGIENTRSRLAAMCGGTLEIQSRHWEGTKATILIPK